MATDNQHRGEASRLVTQSEGRRRDALWAQLRTNAAGLDTVSRHLVFAHAATVTGVEDYGFLGLDVEAAARLRVVKSAAEADYAGPWPPVAWRSDLPGDLLGIAEVIAERTGNAVKLRLMSEWSEDEWFSYLPLVCATGAVPTTEHRLMAAMAADDRMRRSYGAALEAAIDWWANDGPVAAPTEHLWGLIVDRDDAVEDFLALRGQWLWDDPGGRGEAELRGAYQQLQHHPVPVGSGLVRLGNAAALRVALEGPMRYELAFVDTKADRFDHTDALAFGAVIAKAAVT